MFIFRDPCSSFVADGHLFDFVFEVFDRKVEVKIVLILIFFDFKHFRLKLLIMVSTLCVHHFFMVIFSLCLVGPLLLDIVLEVLDLINLVFMLLIMGICINHNLSGG